MRTLWALVSSRYAASAFEQQRLMFLATAGFGDLEQQGAQFFLDMLRPPGPDQLQSVFVDVQMGTTRLDVDQDLNDTFEVDLNVSDGVGLEGPDFDEVQRHDPAFWIHPFVCYGAAQLGQEPECDDPSEKYENNPARLSELFDATLDFDFNGSSDRAINVPFLDSYPDGEPTNFYLSNWSDWRATADPPVSNLVYVGVGAGVWADWGDRMWYLLNLFRLVSMDPEVKQLPFAVNSTRSDSSSFRQNSFGISSQTIETLKFSRWDSVAPEIVAPILPPALVMLSEGMVNLNYSDQELDDALAPLSLAFVSSGALPPGLALVEGFETALTGYPTAVGSFEFEISGFDEAGQPVTSGPFQMTVNPAPEVDPVLTIELVITPTGADVWSLAYTVTNPGPAAFTGDQVGIPWPSPSTLPGATYSYDGCVNGNRIALCPAIPLQPGESFGISASAGTEGVL